MRVQQVNITVTLHVSYIISVVLLEKMIEDQSTSARLPPGGIMEDVDVHSILRKQDIPHHRASDEAVLHR
jgi:hypothetical protein